MAWNPRGDADPDRLRLTYLLYRGETVAPTPTVANAPSEVHLRVNVSAG